MLKILPIMLLSSAQKIPHYGQYFAYKPWAQKSSLHILTALLEYIYFILQVAISLLAMYVDYSIRVYRLIIIQNFLIIFPIMFNTFVYLLCQHNRLGPSFII